jgi:hypothetical protein
MTEPSLEQNMAAARHEHLVPGREIHMQGMRGHRFCEVGLIAGTGQDNAIANIWNTTGVTRHRSNSTHSTPTRSRVKRSPARLAQPR